MSNLGEDIKWNCKKIEVWNDTNKRPIREQRSQVWKVENSSRLIRLRVA